jgi:cellulose biosynthesis protein BcsQ
VSGKSTLATNVAGYFAAQGHAVMLGDADRQQSSRLWLGLRPAVARRITSWDVTPDMIGPPPKGTTHVVLDTPGGLHGKRFKEMVRVADKVIVPLQPSMFDIFATRAFLDELAEQRHAGRLKVGLVGMRVDARTIAADQAARIRRWPGPAGAGFPARHPELRASGGARPHAVRRAAGSRREGSGAVGGHLSLAGHTLTGPDATLTQ